MRPGTCVVCIVGQYLVHRVIDIQQLSGLGEKCFNALHGERHCQAAEQWATTPQYKQERFSTDGNRYLK